MSKHRSHPILTQIFLLVVAGWLGLKIQENYAAIQRDIMLSTMNTTSNRIKLAIQNYYFKQKVAGKIANFPSELDFALDGAKCIRDMACFSHILPGQPDLERWQKINDRVYFYDVNNNGIYNDSETDYVWTYDPVNGTFISTLPKE